jgi:hypothetical protein
VTPEEIATAGAVLDMLREQFRAAGLSRGWSFDWPERSGYAHGERAELVEAVRGKRGDVRDEGGDVLCTAVFGLVPPDVPMADVLAAAMRKIEGIANGSVGVDGNHQEQRELLRSQGLRAHDSERGRHVNPYLQGTEQWQWWDEGWMGGFNGRILESAQ